MKQTVTVGVVKAITFGSLAVAKDAKKK